MAAMKPEPVAWINTLDLPVVSKDIDCTLYESLQCAKEHDWSDSGGEYVPLYPESALAAARRAALEEAAEKCDLLLSPKMTSEWARATHACAAAIRAMKESSDE